MANGEIELLDVLRQVALSGDGVEPLGLTPRNTMERGANNKATLDSLRAELTSTGLDAFQNRITRYWARPAEALRFWTNNVNNPAATAGPFTLPLPSQYSVVSNAAQSGGPGLLISAGAYASPIAKTHLDPEEVAEFTFRQKRRTDNTGTGSTAANVPFNGMAQFDQDGNYISTIDYGGAALLSTDPVRISTYRVSRKAGVGTIDVAAGACFFAPVIGERGSAALGGQMEYASVDRNSQSLGTAPEMTDAIAPEDRIFIFDDSAKLIKKLAALTLAQYVESIVAEKFIPNAADADIGTSPVILIPADAERNSVEIINTSETSGLLIGFDAPPVKGQKNTIRLPAGGTAAYSARYPRRGTIYAASEAETIPVNAFYTNRSGIDVVADGVVAAFFAKVNSANYSNAERDATSTLIKELRINGNPLAKMGSAYILAAPDSQSAAQDLIRPRTLSRFGGPAYTPRKGWTGNGTDQYLSMNYIPRTAPEFKLNDHSLGICVDAAVIPSGPYSMGISAAAIQANRGATAAAMRSGGTTTNVLTVAGRGGMFALSRASPTGYRAFRNEAGQDVTQASDTLGTSDLDMLILAQNNASGPNGFSTLTPYFAWVGSSMTDEQLITISRATAKFKAALDAIV